MLNNKKLVKIAVCMLLSVTLVCASFLEVFAEEVVNYVPYTDTANNLYCHAGISASITRDEGIVHAIQATTLAAKNIESMDSTYTNIKIVTEIFVYDEGRLIHSDVVDYENVENDNNIGDLNLDTMEYGLAVDTNWIVPDVTNPFDYVLTYHTVFDADSILGYDAYGNPRYAVIWDYTGVYGYNDLLLFN